MNAAYKYLITAFLMFSAIGAVMLVSCSDDDGEVSFELPIECDDEEVGIIVGIEFSKFREQTELGNFRGATVRLGLSLPNGKSVLDRCCPLRTWRNWTKPSKEYNKSSPIGLISVSANRWNEDFNPNDPTASSNLPSRLPDGSTDEVPFQSIFKDIPRAKNDTIKVEFITCYGCVESNGLGFKPLGCFTWYYHARGNDIELDGFDEMDLDDVQALNLPMATRPQNVPPEPF
ncbi:MAG: hypothetical protein AAFQ94_28710 [Bacteroidota bacterium]